MGCVTSDLLCRVSLCAVMPILPLLIRSMMEAPMPIFVGLPSSRIDMRAFSSTDQVCVVELDRNQLRWLGAAVEPLPPELVDRLKLELKNKANIGMVWMWLWVALYTLIIDVSFLLCVPLRHHSQSQVSFGVVGFAL